MFCVIKYGFEETQCDRASLLWTPQRRWNMRSITLMGTAAVVLSATTLLAIPASAERICRQVCDEGFCRSRCIERGDRLYMYDRDRDYYYHHRRGGAEIHGPGFDVDIDR